MLFSAKIKIAALVLLVCGVSVGAGAFYLASADTAPPSPPPGVVAPSVPAVPASPAVADVIPGLDPRIAPFVTKRTDILIELDLTKLDLNALAADMHQELGKSKMDPDSAARITGLMQMGVVAGKQWISGFQQAGGTTLYVISRSDQLTAGNAGSGSSLKLTGDVVFPTDSPEAAQGLMRFLRGSRITQLKIVGNAVVDATPGTVNPNTEVAFDPRSSLGAGLSAAGDSPVRIALNPAKLKEIIPRLMASGQVTSSFTGDEWNGVQYAAMNLQLPPSDNPAFIITTHYNDAASAEVAAKMAADRVEQKLKQRPATPSPLAASMFKFMGTETFSVSGTDVIGTMDLRAYYDLLFQAVNAASSPAASRPQ